MTTESEKHPPTNDQIAQLAHDIWAERRAGDIHGDADGDWRKAELILWEGYWRSLPLDKAEQP